MKLAGPPLLVVAVLARPALAEPCAAHVELEGDGAVVDQVRVELSRLGVELDGKPAGCRSVLAHVEVDREGGIAVAIRDGARRSEGRVVSGPAIAASWIDSWLHDDLDGRAWLISAPVAVPAVVSPPRPAVEVEAVATSPTLLERANLAAGWEHVWTDDSASADGVGVAGCVRVGRVCLGGRARYVREAERTVELTAMARGELSLLATASLPLQAGRMSISPELGFGVGRTSTRRIEGCASPAPSDPTMPPPNCDPMDPNCIAPPVTCADPTDNKVYVGDRFSTATISPRLAAGVRLAVPLFDHVWLDGSLALAVSPLAHGQFAGAGEMIGADGTVVPGGFPLPGEATFGMWLGIGLRVGAP